MGVTRVLAARRGWVHVGVLVGGVGGEEEEEEEEENDLMEVDWADISMM